MQNKKPEHVTIVQLFQKEGYAAFFGLGSDSLVYIYDVPTATWSLWV